MNIDDNSTFRIVFLGINSASNPLEARTNLAQLFRISDEQINRILSTPHFVLKRGLLSDVAEKYRSAINKAGGLCTIESDNLMNGNITFQSSDVVEKKLQKIQEVEKSNVLMDMKNSTLPIKDSEHSIESQLVDHLKPGRYNKEDNSENIRIQSNTGVSQKNSHMDNLSNEKNDAETNQDEELLLNKEPKKEEYSKKLIIWGFIFGPLLYFLKGMKKKGVLLFSLAWILPTLFIFISRQLGLHISAYVFTILSTLIVGLICATLINRDYYMHVAHNEKMWKSLSVLDNIPTLIIIPLLSVGIGFAAENNSTPQCSDRESVKLVKDIVVERLGEVGWPQNVISRVSMQLNAIRDKGKNTELNGRTCEAQLTINSPNGEKKLDITYTIERTEEFGEFYVTVFGL